DMAVAVYQAREVLDHAAREIVPAALLQPQHGEVGIPIVDLVKAPARNDVGPWQREQRRIRGTLSVVRLAFEYRPQVVDMCADVLTRRGAIRALVRMLHVEVSLNEGGDIEAGRAAFVLITLHDDGRCVARH